MEEWRALWTGRVTEPELGPLYWYQGVRLGGEANVKEGSIVLSGYPFDAGIQLNQGRTGADEGPDAIREMLAGIPLQHRGISLIDAGDIGPTMTVEESQVALAERTFQVLSKGGISVNLGGGHDISAGTGMGLLRAYSRRKIGIINLDAHWDLRKPNNGANSGTPFYQLLNQSDRFSYLVLGLQREANTQDLMNTAKNLGASYISDEEITEARMQSVVEVLERFMGNIDLIHLSIDMDVFPAAYAPGVSAVNPVGVEPKLAIKLLEKIVSSGKLRAVDVAEVSPVRDIDERTAKLAARLISKIVHLLL